MLRRPLLPLPPLVIPSCREIACRAGDDPDAAYTLVRFDESRPRCSRRPHHAVEERRRRNFGPPLPSRPGYHRGGDAIVGRSLPDRSSDNSARAYRFPPFLADGVTYTVDRWNFSKFVRYFGTIAVLFNRGNAARVNRSGASRNYRRFRNSYQVERALSLVV